MSAVTRVTAACQQPHRLARAMFAPTRLLVVVVVFALLLLTGCGSGQQTITLPRPNASGAPLPTEPSTQTTTTPASSSYPLVHFTYEKVWPFTAQLMSITESPNGYPGGGTGPPPGHTMLMVEVDITSQITDRSVPTPPFKLACSEAGAQFDQAGISGFKVGAEGAPGVSESSIQLADGEPHPWDAEWEVPEGTSTSGVICQLEEPTTYAPVVQNLG